MTSVMMHPRSQGTLGTVENQGTAQKGSPSPPPTSEAETTPGRGPLWDQASHGEAEGVQGGEGALRVHGI